MCGHEICNAYSELNDPEEQRKRMQRQGLPSLPVSGSDNFHVCQFPLGWPAMKRRLQLMKTIALHSTMVCRQRLDGVWESIAWSCCSLDKITSATSCSS